MSILSRDDILSADDLVVEAVPVPEWGGDVLIKVMTGAQRDAFEASRVTSKGKPNLRNIRAHLLSLVIVDEQGNRLFPHPTDVEALGKKGSAGVDRVFEAAKRLNRMTDEDIEELEGNSGGAQSDDFGSDLPSP